MTMEIHIVPLLKLAYKGLGPALMVVYPLFSSIMALESPYKDDDQQWLTYWVLYTLFTLIELTCAPILLYGWVGGLYYFIKLLFTAWLSLPEFRGALFLYETYVHRVLKERQILKNMPEARETKLLKKMSPEARLAMTQVVDKHGLDFLEAILTEAAKPGKAQVQSQVQVQSSTKQE